MRSPRKSETREGDSKNLQAYLDRIGYAGNLAPNLHLLHAVQRAHLLLRVTCLGEAEDAWLVDVGWGNGPREPLRMLAEAEQRQPDESGERIFRLRSEDGYLVFEERGGRGIAGEGQASLADWVRHYRFNFTPYNLSDFEPMCRYHQTSPDSIFTRQRLITRFTPTGRVTLAGQRLVEIEHGQRSERVLASEEEQQILREHFGVEVN